MFYFQWNYDLKSWFSYFFTPFHSWKKALDFFNIQVCMVCTFKKRARSYLLEEKIILTKKCNEIFVVDDKVIRFFFFKPHKNHLHIKYPIFWITYQGIAYINNEYPLQMQYIFLEQYRKLFINLSFSLK